MWQLVKHKLFGECLAWVSESPSWTAGELLDGQVWAQFSDDGPYRPAWPMLTYVCEECGIITDRNDNRQRESWIGGMVFVGEKHTMHSMSNIENPKSDTAVSAVRKYRKWLQFWELDKPDSGK